MERLGEEDCKETNFAREIRVERALSGSFLKRFLNVAVHGIGARTEGRTTEGMKKKQQSSSLEREREERERERRNKLFGIDPKENELGCNCFRRVII